METDPTQQPEKEDTSWMNQPRFSADESKYRLAPHMQRVVDEKSALDEKTIKLNAFIADNPLFGQCSEAERDRLRRQLVAMFDYAHILDERIAAFPIPG